MNSGWGGPPPLDALLVGRPTISQIPSLRLSSKKRKELEPLPWDSYYEEKHDIQIDGASSGVCFFSLILFFVAVGFI